MNDPAPFDDLPDDVQAFLLECFGAVVGNGALVIMALGLCPKCEKVWQELTGPKTMAARRFKF